MLTAFYSNTRSALNVILTHGAPILAFAMILPVAIAYFQTTKIAREAIVNDSERLITFLLSEADSMMSNTERLLDRYLQDQNGSCANEDLVVFRRYYARANAVSALGIVSPDGNVSCFIGSFPIEQISFPAVDQSVENTAKFASVRQKDKRLPLIVKQNSDGIRAFAIISNTRFSRLLLPALLTEYAQLDIVLPDRSLWYSLTGNSVVKGVSENPIRLAQTSSRFPVVVNLVVDKAAIGLWGQSLHTSFALILLLCVAIVGGSVFARITLKKMRNLRRARRREENLERAQSLFEINYQPLLNLDSRLLVGVVAKYDLSIFERVKEDRPTMDEVIKLVWEEVGAFAQKRREFNLVIEVEGEEIVAHETRMRTIKLLKAMEYKNVSLLMKWPSDKGFDSSLYRPLEELATAGCDLAIECGGIRFAFLSDMWTWPYHQLVIDFAQVPASDEAMLWMSDIVMNMSEQLQIRTLAAGLNDQKTLETAIGNGFTVGTGNALGPDLNIESLLAAVRPVGQANAVDGTKEAA